MGKSKKKRKGLWKIPIPEPFKLQNMKDLEVGEWREICLCMLCGKGWDWNLKNHHCPVCGQQGMEVVKRGKMFGKLTPMMFSRKQKRPRKHKKTLEQIQKIKQNREEEMLAMELVEQRSRELIEEHGMDLPIKTIFADAGMSLTLLCKTVVSGVKETKPDDSLNKDWANLYHRILLDWTKLEKDRQDSRRPRLPKSEIKLYVNQHIENLIQQLPEEVRPLLENQVNREVIVNALYKEIEDELKVEEDNETSTSSS